MPGVEVALIADVRVSPTGREIALAIERADGTETRRPGPLIALIDTQTGDVLLDRVLTTAFDWSPDGEWLAMANDSEIQILGAVRSAPPIYVLPVSATALAWR